MRSSTSASLLCETSSLLRHTAGHIVGEVVGVPGGEKLPYVGHLALQLLQAVHLGAKQVHLLKIQQEQDCRKLLLCPQARSFVQLRIKIKMFRPGASAQKSAILSGTHEQTGFFQLRANMSSLK